MPRVLRHYVACIRALKGTQGPERTPGTEEYSTGTRSSLGTKGRAWSVSSSIVCSCGGSSSGDKSCEIHTAQPSRTRMCVCVHVRVCVCMGACVCACVRDARQAQGSGDAGKWVMGGCGGGGGGGTGGKVVAGCWAPPTQACCNTVAPRCSQDGAVRCLEAVAVGVFVQRLQPLLVPVSTHAPPPHCRRNKRRCAARLRGPAVWVCLCMGRREGGRREHSRCCSLSSSACAVMSLPKDAIVAVACARGVLERSASVNLEPSLPSARAALAALATAARRPDELRC